jgi:5'-methylthioinosine phosphorylase
VPYRSIAIIGGTGLGKLATISNDDALEVATPYGAPSAPLMKGRLGIRPVTFLARHGSPHRLLPHEINYRANIHALVEAGCDAILGVNAVGGIPREMAPGDVVIPHDVIDYTYGREHTFGGDGRLLHVDLSEPYTAHIRSALRRAGKQVHALTLHERGVYGCTQGPRLETPAEINRMERDGCAVVGMTGMPEATLAREMGVNYAAVCLVVNAAAGRSASPITLQEIEEVTAGGMEKVEALLTHAIEALYK